MRLVSYNIHAGVGTDGRCDLDRIAALLAEIDADVVALQEVDSRLSRGGLDQAGLLARALGMHLIEGPLLREHQGHYGNAVLSRWPLRLHGEGTYAAQGSECRGWLAVDALDPAGPAWRVLVTHLELRGKVRCRQLAELAAIVAAEPGPLALAGDLNEWRFWRRDLDGLASALDLLPPRATFPSWIPCLALDRLAVKGACIVRGPVVASGTAARLASDHLPLWADLGPLPAAEAGLRESSGTRPDRPFASG